MINPFAKRFKGKLKDLKLALLSGEIDEESNIDFIIEAENDAPSRKAPISSKGEARDIADAAKMEEIGQPDIKSDWKIKELQELPRGDDSFLDRFLKFSQSAGHKDKTDTWAAAEHFINSPEGKAFQMLALLSLLMSGGSAAKEGQAIQEMVSKKGDSTNSKAGKGNIGTLSPNDEIEKTTPLWFKRKITSILKDNMQKRPGGNRTSGDLNFKRLYKIPGGNNRVFQKREHISKKQYNVVLVIDCSGSMSGEPAQIAATCASLICRDFQDLVRLKIKTFNSRDTVVKEFDEKFKAASLIKPRDMIIKECNSPHTGTNHDWYAVMLADQDARQERGEKMIITISDAEPCCGGIDEEEKKGEERFGKEYGNGFKCLQLQNNEIHSKGQVRLMSIVVGELGEDKERMERLYQKNFSHIDKYDEIYRAVTEVLSSAIKRK